MIFKPELQRVTVCIFFVLFLVLGAYIFKDYGISYDEEFSRNNGIITFDYIVKKDQFLMRYGDRDYGTFFEVVLVALEKGFHLSDKPAALFLMRHLATFLLFYLGTIFFFMLCKKILGSWEMGLLGCFFLILSPRIFADAFYNSKDIACLAFFIISTYTLINYLENKTFANAIIHAAVSAALIDIRIVGIIIPYLTLLFVSIDIDIMFLKRTSIKRAIVSFFTYFFYLILLVGLFWPFLWSAPLNNFINVYLSMSHFRWWGKDFYFGQYTKPAELPWHYIPVWIAITTPLTYVITFCFGYIRIMILALRNLPQFYQFKKNELIIFLLFSMPILVVVLLKSVLYDGWRQMYFVYPAFLIISLIGLRSIFNLIRNKPCGIFIQAVIVALIIFNLACVVLFMIRNHPYQNVYFNTLAGRNMKEIKSRFEMDYWGLSYDQALEYIVNHDSDSHIIIYAEDRAFGLETELLCEKDRKRLEFVDKPKNAKYFISIFRSYKGDYHFIDQRNRKINEFYSIKVDGAKILVVYRLK